MTRLAQRRSTGWLLAALLPVLCARALVPAGFMLTVDSGTLAMTFCGAAGPLPMPATAEHAAHAHHTGAGDSAHAAHHHGSDHGAEHGGAHAGADCPFAQSAGPALLPAIALAVSAPGSRATPAVTARSLIVATPPTRHAAARGPPSPLLA